MVYCSAFGCKSRSGQKETGISFHSFPKELEKCKEWVKNMKLDNWMPSKNNRICSKHFEKHWLYKSDTHSRVRLLNEAVPTIFSELPNYLQPKKYCRIISMWATLATNVLQAVASKYLPSNSTTQNSNSGPENYDVTGYINNIPVDLQVARSSSSSARPKTNLRSFEPNEISNRSLSIPQPLYSGTVPTCQNCSTSKPSNKKTQNDGNDNKLCRIALPSEGNYDVRIRKTDSNFAAMKISDKRSFKSSGPQNKQYGNQNKQSENQNKPNRNQNKQNGNCNNCTGNQNRQNGNYNKQIGNQNKQNENYNNQTGNQNKQNGNYNNQMGNQNKRNGNYNNQTRNQNGFETKRNLQSKPQIKNRKPGELKLGNGNRSNRQVKYGSFGDLRAGNAYQSTWMYVGRLKQGTTETDLRIYLEAMFQGYNFIVESLPLYKNAKLPCFKVKVDNSILAEFKKADSWPNGATVTEFIENFKS